MILDAYPLLALLLGEPARAEVEPLLRGETPIALTTVGLAEVIDRTTRHGDIALGRIVSDVARLGLEPSIELDEPTALLAGDLRARHYHRTNRPVSLADCVAAATAARRNRPLVTNDGALLTMCHEERIPVRVVPDSVGARWSAP